MIGRGLSILAACGPHTAPVRLRAAPSRRARTPKGRMLPDQIARGGNCRECDVIQGANCKLTLWVVLPRSGCRFNLWGAVHVQGSVQLADASCPVRDCARADIVWRRRGRRHWQHTDALISSTPSAATCERGAQRDGDGGRCGAAGRAVFHAGCLGNDRCGHGSADLQLGADRRALGRHSGCDAGRAGRRAGAGTDGAFEPLALCISTCYTHASNKLELYIMSMVIPSKSPLYFDEFYIIMKLWNNNL